MKKAPRNRVAGMGTAVGAVILFGTVIGLGCAPGALPCDPPKDDDWKKICAMTPGTGAVGGTNTGGSSGSGGGTPPGSGGMAMADAGGTGGLAAKEVPNCADYKTVGDMETKFFAMRCGEGAACHAAMSPFGDLKGSGMSTRMLDKPATLNCLTPMPAKWIDKADYMKSLMLVKGMDMPKCPQDNTKMAGARMPSAPMMPLSAAETNCLKSYLEVVTKQ
jgi:hypothetical protein